MPPFSTSQKHQRARPRGRGWITFVFLLLATPGFGAEVKETFAVDPLAHGWRIGGDASLFRWSPGGLEVTWDSSKSNSFFHLPLPTVLSRVDSFELSFVLRMGDIRVGITPGKPAEFPIAIGLINRQLLTSQAYRGAGVSSLYGVRNILEWDFFPDAGFGDTWATTVVSSNNVFAFGHNFPVPLLVGDTYQVTLAYTASNQILRTFALRNGQSIGNLESVPLAGRPDFRLDALSITSYSDAVQTGSPAYYGSVLAHGLVEEISVSFPSPPDVRLVLTMTPGGVNVQFGSRTNWRHTLERSIRFESWQPVGPPIQGTGGPITIRDAAPPQPGGFYRVRSEPL